MRFSDMPREVQRFLFLHRLTDNLLKAIPCKEGEPYIVGEKYYSGFWFYVYEVLSVNGREVTIKKQSGEIVTHCVPLCCVDWHFIKAT